MTRNGMKIMGEMDAVLCRIQKVMPQLDVTALNSEQLAHARSILADYGF